MKYGTAHGHMRCRILHTQSSPGRCNRSQCPGLTPGSICTWMWERPPTSYMSTGGAWYPGPHPPPHLSLLLHLEEGVEERETGRIAILYSLRLAILSSENHTVSNPPGLSQGYVTSGPSEWHVLCRELQNLLKPILQAVPGWACFGGNAPRPKGGPSLSELCCLPPITSSPHTCILLRYMKPWPTPALPHTPLFSLG